MEREGRRWDPLSGGRVEVEQRLVEVLSEEGAHPADLIFGRRKQLFEAYLKVAVRPETRSGASPGSHPSAPQECALNDAAIKTRAWDDAESLPSRITWMNCASGYTIASSARCRKAFGVLFPQRPLPCAKARDAASTRMAPAASVMPSSAAYRAGRPGVEAMRPETRMRLGQCQRFRGVRRARPQAERDID